MIFQGILIVECMGGPPPMQTAAVWWRLRRRRPPPCFFRLATWDILNVLRWCVDAKRSEITKPISCQGVQGKRPYRPDAIPMCLRPIVSLTWFDRERSLTFLNCFQKVHVLIFPSGSQMAHDFHFRLLRCWHCCCAIHRRTQALLCALWMVVGICSSRSGQLHGPVSRSSVFEASPQKSQKNTHLKML